MESNVERDVSIDGLGQPFSMGAKLSTTEVHDSVGVPVQWHAGDRLGRSGTIEMI